MNTKKYGNMLKYVKNQWLIGNYDC
jgi:hypothetical protein